MAYPDDRLRLTEFEATHTETEIAIFKTIQGFDILNMVFDTEYHCAEYLTGAQEFLAWLTGKEPSFDEVVQELRTLFDDMCFPFDNPTDESYKDLACHLCIVIYYSDWESA